MIKENINIALVSPNHNAISETFIKRHKDSFDGSIIMYFGSEKPIYNDKDKKVIGGGLTSYVHKTLNKIFKLNINVYEEGLSLTFKRHNISVCYAEYGVTGINVMNTCKNLDIPLIVNFHGFDIFKHDLLSKNIEHYKKLFQISHTIIGVSKAMCARLEDLGCPKNKIEYIPCFPDPRFFDINPNTNSNKLLCVGRFVDKKAPYLTILAFEKVVQTLPESELVLIGDGPLLNICKNLIKVRNIKNVTLAGAQNHVFVRNLFSDCALFLQHSIIADSGDQEGTPVAVMEASASGLPVVATKHAGIPDIIQDSKMGYLIDELDIDEMAEKIIFLLKNREHLKQMSLYSKAYMKEHFCDLKYKELLNSVINKALQKA
jgi:colanic acid/amylovoran biosynthesis glycosyltransferase